VILSQARNGKDQEPLARRADGPPDEAWCRVKWEQYQRREENGDDRLQDGTMDATGKDQEPRSPYPGASPG